jgi:uncharacterized protein (DUF1697 family)
MARLVALLRAINVGGRGMVAMADLRDLFDALGFPDARSLLQSGNVVFHGDRRTPAAVEGLLEEATAERLRIETSYFVRTAKQWSDIIAANPFRREAKETPGHLHMLCLKKAPTASDVKSLQAAVRGPEIVRAVGPQAYIVYPDGAGRSRLTPTLIESKLGTRGTARNWNTVLKIAALLAT